MVNKECKERKIRNEESDGNGVEKKLKKMKDEKKWGGGEKGNEKFNERSREKLRKKKCNI